ncbi:hypothetical protein AURDEDRAFT_115191 [Auricularia subglabra TFB-10046 SS5]|nr:hypothetical protein AURDEDRAFT_115191 [Auricularia subglabra TFB-10046 SS5]
MAPQRAQYTAVPHQADDEMEAAFESDDEQEHRPMLAHSRSPSMPTPGGYDFERVDYDYPPPGSPPRPSAQALPNDIGNSNGQLPSEQQVWRPAGASSSGARGFFQRLWPARYQRLAGGSSTAVVGGGVENDGVFANVVAKPQGARVEQTPDGVYVVPEETQKDAPPSYAAAQADAVPPYWETTVHAPSAGSSTAGEMMVDNLPTGTLFSFLWNMLVSLSFNFVGFLLTYLLHTTHAAKYGSRAGLGVTLLQYGFALRNREIGQPGQAGEWGSWEEPDPTPSTDVPTLTPGNATTPVSSEQEVAGAVPYPQEWIAFFLMTMGWFLLLTSFLGYWRVKRWEHQILASAAAQNASTPEAVERDRAVRQNLERIFGLHFARRGAAASASAAAAAAARDPLAVDLEAGRRRPASAERDNDEPMTNEERRLRDDLRAAGLI